MIRRINLFKRTKKEAKKFTNIFLKSILQDCYQLNQESPKNEI